MHSYLQDMDVTAFARQFAHHIYTLKHVHLGFRHHQQPDKSWKVVRPPEGEPDIEEESPE